MKQFFVTLWKSPMIDVIIGLVAMSSIGLVMWKISMSRIAPSIENAISMIMLGVGVEFLFIVAIFGAWFTGLIIRTMFIDYINQIKHSIEVRKFNKEFGPNGSR